MKTSTVLPIALAVGLCPVGIEAQACPEMVGLWPYGPAVAVAVSGTHAYLVSGGALASLNVSQPDMPVLVGSLPLLPLPDGGVRDLAASDTDPWVVVIGSSDLRVVDVSNPSVPVEIGFYDLSPFSGDAIVVKGGLAYVAGSQTDTHTASLLVIDLSTPAAPVVLGSFEGGVYEGYDALAVEGPYAYVVGRKLRVIDVSDPSEPFGVGQYAFPYVYSMNDIAVAGGYAYVIWVDDPDLWEEPYMLEVFDVSNPTAPEAVSLSTSDHHFQRFVVAGDHAYMAHGYTGITLLDLQDPSHPLATGTCDTPGEAVDLAIAGGQALVADRNGGLRVFDGLTEIGSYETPGVTRLAAAVGDYVYTLDHGLRVIDVSSPAAPVEVGFQSCPCSHPGGYTGPPHDLAVAEGYVYVADDACGLRVVDVTTPSAPTEAGFCEFPHEARDVAVAAGHAYVAAGGAGLQVVDVSAPSVPVTVGVFTPPSPPWDVWYFLSVAVSGRYAYVADHSSGLWIIDVSDPEAPEGVGHCDTQGSPMSVVGVSGGFVYLTDYDNSDYELLAIDVSQPTAPFVSWYYPNVGSAVVAGRYMYLGQGSVLRVLDLSEPWFPLEVCSLPADLGAPAAVDDGYVYLRRLSYGLVIRTELLFVDGFQTADASRWSAAVP